MGTFNSATTIKIKQAISDNIFLNILSTTYTYTVPANSYFDGHLYLDSWSVLTINVAGVTNWPAPSSAEGKRVALKLGPGETVTLTRTGTDVNGHLIGTLFENAGAVV